VSLEVEINVDGKVRKVNIEEPKGKHQKEYLKIWSEVLTKPENAVLFLNFRDKLAMELTGLDEKYLDELALVEKEKILEKIESRILMLERRTFLPNASPSQS
jgi:hypothetical protein